MRKNSECIRLVCQTFIVTLLLAFSTSEYLGDEHANFGIKYNTHGEFDVMVDGSVWLQSSDIWFHIYNTTCSVSNYCLDLTSTYKNTGSDRLGKYQALTQTWMSALGPSFRTVVKSYVDLGVVLFGHVYLNHAYYTSMGSTKKTSSGFPVFKVGDGRADNDTLGFYAASGNMCGFTKPAFEKWTINMNFPSGYETGPIALYNGKGDTIIMSAFSHFMSQSVWYDKQHHQVSFGLLGRASSVPRLQASWTILYHSSKGVNQAFSGWGAVMQKYYQSRNREYATGDIFLNFLGYWTDRGAFYYYHKEPNTTYEETMLRVWNDSKAMHVPYRFLQYDSWFYPKHNNSGNGGAMKWIPVEKEFPHGAGYIVKQTHVPVGTHLKWWSPHTPLAKQNGGPFDFAIEKKMALPTDDRFYFHVLKKSKEWGNKMLLQDWLAQMFDNLDILQTNVTIGDQWLHSLGKAAQLNDLTVELCTTYPRHNLAALQMESVTFTRVSEDYQPSNNNWKIGFTSLWIWSIGQTPLKDVFLTSSNQSLAAVSLQRDPRTGLIMEQPNENKKLVEHYPELEAVIASLSAGPVAPGDQIAKTNVSLLMRCCNADGLLLKPDKPATAIDELFYTRSFKKQAGPQGEVYTTYTSIAGHVFGVILAADMSNQYHITPQLAGLQVNGSYAYDYLSRAHPQPFKENKPLALTNCTKLHFCLYYTTPLITYGKSRSVLLLGEMSKWVPIATQRVLDLDINDDDVKVTLVGAVNEVVDFTLYMVEEQKYILYVCNMGPNGRALLSAQWGKCTSL